MKAITLDQYRENIKENMGLLDIAIQSGKYPRLAALLLSHSKSLYNKLSALHRYFNNYGDDVRQRLSYFDGRGWEMMLSYDTITSLGAGKDKATWEKAILKLCALQMLGCFRPRGGEYSFLNSAVQQLSADRAEAAGRKPVTWYRIPRYTDKLLSIAEKKAEAVQQLGSGIDKDAIRDIWGADQANRVTDTGYTMHTETKERREALRNALIRQLASKGYTDKASVIKEARHVTEALYSAYRWVDTWKAYKPTLLKELSLKESKPTKAEKQKFNTTSDSWIIRKA